jgi:hypothetical protein
LNSDFRKNSAIIRFSSAAFRTALQLTVPHYPLGIWRGGAYLWAGLIRILFRKYVIGIFAGSFNILTQNRRGFPLSFNTSAVTVTYKGQRRPLSQFLRITMHFMVVRGFLVLS